MGKLSDSLLSGSYGRTGRLVVANLAGTEILRARPRRRSGAPSAKQALVQQRMKRSYDFISAYKHYAKQYFGTRIGMKSPYNLAMTNILAAMKLNYATSTVEPAYQEIEFSRGSLLTAIPTAVSTPAAATFQVQWFNNSGGNPDREADQLQLLYYAEGDLKPVLLENAAVRLDTLLDVALPPAFTGKTVHVWIAFRSDDLMSVSVSSYAGSIVIT